MANLLEELTQIDRDLKRVFVDNHAPRVIGISSGVRDGIELGILHSAAINLYF